MKHTHDTTVTEPVNPLVGDLTTITIVNTRSKGGAEDVQGLVVAPGLAITPSPSNRKRPTARYSLTHLGSGLTAGPSWCGAHVTAAADLAVKSGVDWTVPDKDAVVKAIKATTYLKDVSALGSCLDTYCSGDGPAPPSWSVRCNTCDWQYDPEEDGSGDPVTLDDARRMADDHECEPLMEFSAPDAMDWHPAWMYDKDGQLFPTTGACKHCGEPVQNVGRQYGALWQHTAGRFVMCTDARTLAEPAELEGTDIRGNH